MCRHKQLHSTWLRLSVALLVAVTVDVASPVSVFRASDVCLRWTRDRANMKPVVWSKSTYDCPIGRVNRSDPGSIRESDEQRMIGQLNLYRWLSGFNRTVLSGGQFSEDMRNPGYPQYKSSWAGLARNDAAQACAFMLGSNDGIHFGHDDYCFVMGHIGTYQPQCGGVDPSDRSYKCHCYTYANDEATFLGGIAAFDGVAAMDAYMVDYGSISSVPLGHRRLVLAEHLGPVGVGAVGPAMQTGKSYSCLSMVDPAVEPEARDWIAFPGPGFIPHEALYPYGVPDNCSAPKKDCWARNNDYMGWSQVVDLSGAVVSIAKRLTSDPSASWESPGPQREVLFAPAVGVAGVAAGNTLVFGPQIHPTSGAAWQSQPGYKYRVTVSTKTQKIEYEFGVLTCE
eukprot:m.308822 g.308822  ORF g.308822 m.308822 type:complete len:397 (+) comp20193_c0_seq9:123-1313(+)